MASVELPVGISFIPIYSVLFRFYLHDIPKSLLVVGLMFRLPAAYNGPGPSLSCQTSSPFFLWSNSIQTPCSASSFSCSYDQWKAQFGWIHDELAKEGGMFLALLMNEFDLIWSDLIWFDLIWLMDWWSRSCWWRWRIWVKHGGMQAYLSILLIWNNPIIKWYQVCAIPLQYWTMVSGGA